MAENTQQVTDQNLIPRSDLHALNHNSFLLSKSHAHHSTVAGPCKKLKVVFRAGDTVVNMSPCALAADQLMGEKQKLRAPSLLRGS